jgi:hypothetical protein
MKKLIFSVMLAAFALGVQAGDDKSACTDKEGASCCAKAKTSEQAKGECPMAKQAKATCPYAVKNGTKEAANKQTLQSPKALADARK